MLRCIKPKMDEDEAFYGALVHDKLWYVQLNL